MHHGSAARFVQHLHIADNFSQPSSYPYLQTWRFILTLLFLQVCPNFRTMPHALITCTVEPIRKPPSDIYKGDEKVYSVSRPRDGYF
eukprot:g76905.t1